MVVLLQLLRFNAIVVHVYISLNNESHGFWKFHFNLISCIHLINGFSAFVLNFKCADRHTCNKSSTIEEKFYFLFLHSLWSSPKCTFCYATIFYCFLLIAYKTYMQKYIYVYKEKVAMSADEEQKLNCIKMLLMSTNQKICEM